jgi:RNase P/RNase MRP subunit p29
LAVEAVSAAEPSVLKLDWDNFQRQVAERKLNNRKALIGLTTGDVVEAHLLHAGDEGLVVKSNRATKQWATAKGEAMLPRAVVSAVTFRGKVGRRGLIGGLAGLGAGAGIAAASATTMDGGSCEGGSCGIVVVAVPVLAVAGWFIGHAANPSAPSFLIARAPIKK